MKYNVIVFIITCVMSVSLASSNHKVERVHSEVMSYVHEKMGNTKMMRGNLAHLECYNGFIPLINQLASNARNVSNYCVSDANQKKDEYMSDLKIQREEIEYDVERITKSFVDCSKKEGLQYFQCLANNAELNRKIMESIGNNSKRLISKYAQKFAEIDENEQICLMDAIDMAKLASDKAFTDLKSCLNGGPAISPFIDEV